MRALPHRAATPVPQLRVWTAGGAAVLVRSLRSAGGVPLKTVVADLLAGGFAGRGDGYPAAPLRAIDVMSALNRLRAPELFVMR